MTQRYPEVEPSFEPSFVPAPVTCAMCGQPAAGFASIGDDRYCHGDGDDDPTCYMRAQFLLSAPIVRPEPPVLPLRDGCGLCRKGAPCARCRGKRWRPGG